MMQRRWEAPAGRVTLASLVAGGALVLAMVGGVETRAASGTATAGDGGDGDGVTASRSSMQARSSGTRLSPRVRRQLRRVRRLMRRGKMRRARKLGRRIRKRRVPQRRANYPSCGTVTACTASSAARRRGCGVAHGTAVYDVDVLGFDTFKPSLGQAYCWRRGRITELGGISVAANITTFGSVINFRNDGVVYSDAKWKRWRGRRHGKRVLVRVVRITGCTSVPYVGGCLFPKRYNVALALVMRGNGTFGFGSAF